MYQDSLKSAIRRSLTKPLQLPSADGHEAVQSRAIGKPKTGSAMEFTSGRSHSGQDPTSSKGREEEQAVAYRNSNDFQLLQVSREAHRLAQVIDSWSNSAKIDSRSQFFADDLLRGALGLQESLDMLKKCQDASRKMPRINSKQKQVEEICERELGSQRFAVSNYQNRLHESRSSADDFSRDCVEELKQVIKESLHKTNILSSSSDDEKNSSSRSMRYGTINHFEDKHLAKSTVPVTSICSTDNPRKARSSNLIAKLMGLEQARPEIVQPSKKEEKKNCVNSRRPGFDVEMPKAREMPYLAQDKCQKQHELDELIETMHFERRLKQSQVEENGLEMPFFGATDPKQCRRNLHNVEQLPPIVIMKSLHLRYQESDVEKGLDRDKTSMQDRIQAVKLVRENSSYHKHVLAKTLEAKEVKHMEMDVTEPLPYYETPSSLFHKQQKKAVTVQKKNTGEEKPSRLNVKKQEEKRVKATRIPISHPKISAVQEKPNKELPVARTKASAHVTATQNQDLKSPLRPISKAPIDCSKNRNRSGAKPIRKSAIAESVDDGKKRKENGKSIRSNKTNDVPEVTGTSHGDDEFKQAGQDTKPFDPDNVNKDHNIFCEATSKNNQDGKDYRLTEAVQLPDCNKVDAAAAGTDDELKNVFLSSRSFVGCAKQFFNVDATEPVHHRSESADEVGKCDSKLLLDISEELMTRKYHQQKHHLGHPLMQAKSWSRLTYLSIDKLVEEIIDRIRKLSSYSKLDSVAASEDSLYIRLERELTCKDPAINSVWDIGWDNRICPEEADQVAEELGKQILSSLIQESALELVQGQCR
ncbi:unnamed protein product [Musa acuminata subsp. malaccensis]|uniref:(wild Malaysian banana) hypothetical protein n=1 Tax=Musa acuminata subsp. malaccensis TaxID=214687 RepID=A0A804JGK4_MUSAM|nr:PREDICTED: uncharacterized protein LOC103987772 [Musa acuminata subsp. malaccensis]XP_009404443.1 PREDICTED: uncharacterized protein LOC103987772 [Musa acuminata subsp. malaccensis]XP_009404444.1 PREDICTED: uncharacterized protein LOC103987772 [Musa acuminata subsp. malaccensis]CAG1846353.1 unnamed protein product [Musa acuminata subsp. malaccensis]